VEVDVLKAKDAERLFTVHGHDRKDGNLARVDGVLDLIEADTVLVIGVLTPTFAAYGVGTKQSDDKIARSQPLTDLVRPSSAGTNAFLILPDRIAGSLKLVAQAEGQFHRVAMTAAQKEPRSA
jgi:hypothetical protein